MAQTKQNRRGFRRFLYGAGIFVALLVIFFFLAPVFVGWGLFHGRIRDAIGASFNGDIEVDGISVSWFGEQQIDTLHITGPGGDAEVHLSVRLERGLLPLAFGSTDYGVLHLAGAIEGVRYEDGSTSLQKLLKEDNETEPLDLTIDIVADGIDIALRDLATGDELAVRDLAGHVALDPTGRTEIALKAETAAPGKSGHLEVAGTIDGMYDGAGAIALRTAKFDVTARLSQLPVAVVDGLLGLDGQLSALAGDAIESAEIAIDGDAESGAAQVAIATSQLGIDAAVTLAQGDLLVDPGAPAEISLNLPAASVETLLGGEEEPAIAVAPGQSPAIRAEITQARISLPGDAGLDLSGALISLLVETNDLPLIARSGDIVETIDVASLTATIESNDLTRQATITIDGSGAVRGEEESAINARLAIAQPIASDGAVTIDPANIEGDLTASNLPTAIAQALLGESPIVLARDIGPSADLSVEFSGGEPRTVHATLAAANADGELRAVIGREGSIQGDLLRFSLRMTPELSASIVPDRLAAPRLLEVDLSTFTLPAPAEDGPRAWESIGAAGTLELSGDVAGALDAVDPIAIEAATIEFNTPALFESLTAKISAVVEGGSIDADITAGATENSLVLTGLDARAQVTQNLVRALQSASEDPIEARAGEVKLSLASPVTIFRRGDEGIELGFEAVALRIASPEIVVERAPSLAVPVALLGLAADLRATLGESGSLALEGNTIVNTRDSTPDALEAIVANATFALDMPLASRGAPEAAAEEPGEYPALDLTLTEIDVGAVETIFGREAGSLEKYLGSSGALEIAFEPSDAGFEATLIPAFPYVAGTFRAVRDASTIAIDAEDATITLSAGAVSEFLTPVADPSTPNAPAATVAAAGDVPLSLDISSLVLPAEILTGEPLAETAAEIDVALAIREPLALTRTAGSAPPETVQFEELSLALKSDDLDGGVALTLTGLVKSAAAESEAAEGAAAEAPETQRSRIDISATLANLVNDAMELDPAGATVTGQARARRVPAWIADAAASTNSLLRDALGESITLEATAESFSSNSGTLAANIGGANESRIRAKLTGRDGGFAAERGDPVTGALTLSPELRNRLLHGIHPILSDVRALNDQVRFKVRNAFVPAKRGEPPVTSDAATGLDSGVHGNDDQALIDLSRLSGVIELTIGPAEFTAGSEFLRILSFVEAFEGGQLPSPPGRGQDEGRSDPSPTGGGRGQGEGEQPSAEKIIEGFIGPLDGSPIVIRINNGRMTYDNFVVHLEREEEEEATPRPRRRDRQGEGSGDSASEPSPPAGGSGQGEGAQPATPPAPAQYEHQLLFSGDVDLVNRRVNRIVGAYPLSDLISNIRGSAPADLLGLNIGTVGVRFFGDLFDAGGNPLDLQMEIDFDLKVEDLFREGLRRTPGEDAPALQRLLEEIFK